MIAGSRRLFLGATALAVVCLLGVAMEAGQSRTRGRSRTGRDGPCAP